MRMILASGSPRRRELMENLNVQNLEIIPAVGEEQPHPELEPSDLVKELSRAKAAEIAAQHPDAIVIGADTVVSIDGRVLGKPHSVAEAAEMLHTLSGRAHDVFTGVTVIKDGEVLSEYERTRVFFRELSDREIDAYIATGEPMDKAGAYGAQGYASLFVERLEGDFFNVMGLPVCRLGIMLNSLGVSLI